MPRTLRRLGSILLATALALLTLAGIYGTGSAWRPGDEAPPPATPAVPPRAGAPDGRIVVAVVVGEGGSEITDALAPYEVFARSSAFFPYTVSSKRRPVPLFGGPALLPDYATADVDAGVAPAPDVVVVPRLEDPTGTLGTWVARQADRGSYVLGVCNGAYVLAAAGLLDGRRATAYWNSIDSLEGRYPAVDWVRGQRYVHDGRIVTTAGITSGIPGALHLVRDLAGATEAERVGRAVGYPGWSLAASTEIPVHRQAPSDLPIWFHDNIAWRPSIGIGLVPGAGEIDIAATFDVYSVSSAARAIPIAAGQTVTTQHGMVLLATPADPATAGIERLVVPGVASADQLDQRLAQWAADRDVDVELVHASRAAGESGFDAVLRNLAEHTDRATARVTAKYLEYPSDHLRLDGPSWPRRPVGLLALTLAAAVGAGLAPTALRALVRRRRRRRTAAA
jgi:putative intracellular protease/amidase